MRKLLLSLVAATALIGSAAVLTPASAAPAMPFGVTAPESGVDQAAYRSRREMRRHRMMRHRVKRHRMMRRHSMRRGRGAMRRDSGNSESPALPVRAQRQGNTTGGPSR